MTKHLTLLDLFAGAGGASRGYQLAGFDVTGVDIERQPRYAGNRFIQADALEYVAKHGHEYDVIAASPPCQAFTALRTMHNAKPHADLLTPTRALLQASGVPYVIENVVGAPMQGAYIVLCGTMFNLGCGDAELRRHRLFELSFGYLLVPPCQHGGRERVVGVYGGHGRDRRRQKSIHSGTQQFSVAGRREAMGIDWMNGAELSQAIPPAYTNFIGLALRRALWPLESVA